MSDAPFDHNAYLRTLTGRPGVYRMLNGEGRVLYVGKARDLKRRVSSYFNRALNRRIQNMVSQIRAIEVTVTNTESEALILENNLIKSLRPRYNVLLRDDKSYPYIHLSADPFPQLSFHRGARRGGGRYFGPYPSAGAVRETLRLMQKLFPVRQCEESFYRNRSRPCLQYQIKRCTAPCVDLVSAEDYAADVRDARLFLEGRTSQVIDELVARMERASTKLEFERAAQLRDQVSALRRIQEKQYVSGSQGSLDILACVGKAGVANVQLFVVRNGRNLGNKSFFPKLPAEASLPHILRAFIGQYYIGRQVPGELLVTIEPEERDLLESVLSDERGHRVRIRSRVRGDRARWLALARQNAELALAARLASRSGMLERYEQLQGALELEELPQRLECFDISHTAGELAVASCVVFNQEGPLKRSYRRFNIEGIEPGDDYAAMAQALQRRYTRLQSGEEPLPDVLFIDGGKGQLRAAEEVLEESAVAGVTLVGVAKGADRKAGLERLFLSTRKAPIILPPSSPALLLVQQIRDEAHRFAISGHRQRREKRRRASTLETIPGIGPKRRQRLLKQFGGLQGVSRAGVDDLCRIEGISRALAELIYQAFHGEA
ncbi:MAG: excinuclease ABC subunit UvrC [Gammaproteobacteria bacterium]|nr:excinuclease ABC subunit UvrC [Gammaproteobacteria bacterium]